MDMVEEISIIHIEDVKITYQHKGFDISLN
jgi:hypothetical protein